MHTRDLQSTHSPRRSFTTIVLTNDEDLPCSCYHVTCHTEHLQVFTGSSVWSDTHLVTNTADHVVLTDYKHQSLVTSSPSSNDQLTKPLKYLACNGFLFMRQNFSQNWLTLAAAATVLNSFLEDYISWKLYFLYLRFFLQFYVSMMWRNYQPC